VVVVALVAQDKLEHQVSPAMAVLPISHPLAERTLTTLVAVAAVVAMKVGLVSG
jgi:hypothetical protein